MNYKIFHPSLLAFLLLPILLAATPPAGGYQEFEKTYTESFAVDGSGEVRLSNRYGDINVTTWDRNEVRFDVRVTVTADDQEDADRAFDRIGISFSGGGNVASAVTTIDGLKRKEKKKEKESRSIFNMIFDMEWTWGETEYRISNHADDFKVRYDVKMPASVRLETDAKYCDVNLPDLSGATRLSVAYGNLVAGDLTGTNEISASYGSARVDALGDDSSFRVRYCDGNQVRRATDLHYDGRYSESEIGTVGRLTINAGYEEVEVDAADEIRFTGNYNELDVETVGRLFYESNYSDLTVNEITKELEATASYGDLEVEEVRSGFDRIYVRAKYIDVEIDLDGTSGYTLDLKSIYGDISYDSGHAKVRVNKSGNTCTVTGRMPGLGNGKVDISTSYGDIELD